MSSKGLKVLPPAGSVTEALRLSDVLSFSVFSGARLITDTASLDSPVNHVNVMQIPTDRFAKPNELLLASESAFVDIENQQLIAALAAKEITALAVRSPDLRTLLGPQALQVANAHRLAIIELPESIHLSDAQTAVLEHLILKRAEELNAAADVREELSASALAGGGLSSLVGRVSSLVEAPAWIIDESGQVLESSDGQETLSFDDLLKAYFSGDISAPVASEDGFVLSPIAVPYRRLGVLVCRLTWPLDNGELAAIEHGTTIAALQISHLQGADEATMRFRSAFIRDLLGGTLDPTSAGRRAGSVGWNPKWSFRVILLRPGGHRARLAGVLSSYLPDALVTNHGRSLLLIVPEGALAAADRLIEDVAGDRDDIRVGISSQHQGLAHVSTALEQAEEALRASETFDKNGRVRFFDDLGPLRFLSGVPRDELERFVSQTLRPLNELDDEYRRALEETLRHLIEANLNVAQAARDGGWHYNTLRYRIERLTELLGPFMEDGTTLDSISLALFLRDEVSVS